MQNKSYDVPHSLPFQCNRKTVVVRHGTYKIQNKKLHMLYFTNTTEHVKITVRMQPWFEYMHCVMILDEIVYFKHTVAKENNISTSFVRSIQQKTVVVIHEQFKLQSRNCPQLNLPIKQKHARS